MKKITGLTTPDFSWNNPAWRNAIELKLDFVLPESSSHRPDTRVKMLYDNQHIFGLFQVHDQYVKAVSRKNQDMVCADSCVEFFVRSSGVARYFNFEMNCGGKILLYHIKDCRSGDYTVIPECDLNTITIFHTLPEIIEGELSEPVTWYLVFKIPISFFHKYSGINTQLSGQKWAAILQNAQTKHLIHISYPGKSYLNRNFICRDVLESCALNDC